MLCIEKQTPTLVLVKASQLLENIWKVSSSVAFCMMMDRITCFSRFGCVSGYPATKNLTKSMIFPLRLLFAQVDF